jgi:hypothetical protein
MCDRRQTAVALALVAARGAMKLGGDEVYGFNSEAQSRTDEAFLFVFFSPQRLRVMP